MLHLHAAAETGAPVQVLWDLRYWFIEKFSISAEQAPFVVLGATLLCVLIPYFLGSINPAIIISNIRHRRDIRNFGSGNAGTTNMLRTFGRKSAVMTFFFDLLKAALSVLVGRLLLGIDGGALAGFFVLFGHMFPIYYRFHGGKGVACLSMVILLTDPITFAILFVLFFIIVIGTRYVSLASVMCSLLYPLILRAFANAGLNVAMAVVSACFVTYMHRENLKRLWAGKESKLDLSLFKPGKKKKAAEPAAVEEAPLEETEEGHE